MHQTLEIKEEVIAPHKTIVVELLQRAEESIPELLARVHRTEYILECWKTNIRGKLVQQNSQSVPGERLLDFCCEIQIELERHNPSELRVVRRNITDSFDIDIGEVCCLRLLLLGFLENLHLEEEEDVPKIQSLMQARIGEVIRLLKNAKFQ